MDKKYDDEKNNIRAQFTELKNETIEKFEDKVTEILADYPQSKDLNEEETQVKAENNKIAKARENIKSQFIELENETMEKFEDKVTEILADYHKSEEFDEEEQPKEDLEENMNTKAEISEEDIKDIPNETSEANEVEKEDEEQSEKSEESLEENMNIETKVLDEPIKQDIKQDFSVNIEPKLVVDDEEQSEKLEENLEENKNSKNEETALTTTSKIPRFLNKFPRLAKFYIGLSTTLAALSFTGVHSNLNQHEPEKVQGREKNIEETKSTDDSYKKNLLPDKKQSLEIVEKTLEADKQYAETQEVQETQEEQETQESEFKKGLKARTESVDTMLENMRKAGIDSDDVNRTPENQPVSGKNFDERTAQVDESSVPEDKNKEAKKDLNDVKEATGTTEVVKPTTSEVTKKDEIKTDETKKEETKIEDKGTVIKKDSDVTIVVTPEGETIKQEKDKDGNIKKEEHYVDENPFER